MNAYRRWLIGALLALIAIPPTAEAADAEPNLAILGPRRPSKLKRAATRELRLAFDTLGSVRVLDETFRSIKAARAAGAELAVAFVPRFGRRSSKVRITVFDVKTGRRAYRALRRVEDRSASTIAQTVATEVDTWLLDRPAAATGSQRSKARRPVARSPKKKKASAKKPTEVREPGRAAFRADGPTTAAEVERSTSNPLAHGLLWGGLAVAAGGAAAGLIGKFGYTDKVSDGTVRSAADNQALLDTGDQLALAGDIALIAGGVSAGLGALFLLTGVGESVDDEPTLGARGLIPNATIVPLEGGTHASLGWSF